jgi:3',5'-cyclic AMP phosphodiesterase CpdA
MTTIPQSRIPRVNRRGFLTRVTATSAAAVAAPFLTRKALAEVAPAESFRFAFLPCIHLRRELRSPEGFAHALRAVRQLSPPPDFVLTGGDLCQNLRDQTIAQSVEITDLFLKLYHEHGALPAHHCLGNHDLAAWNQVDTAAADPLYGKQLTVKKLGMRGRYYSFDHAGWHFVVLDYLRVSAPGQFTAEIDPEQLAWLGEDLARAQARPTVVVTHAPVISAVELLSDRAQRTDTALAVPFGRVISNGPALIEAAKAGNVRAFISGHLHLIERLELAGHTFICSGSVSGHQWTGPRMGTPPGFGVFDCHPDGTFAFRYEPHGWKA